jgi:hypothetical protein
LFQFKTHEAQEKEVSIQKLTFMGPTPSKMVCKITFEMRIIFQYQMLVRLVRIYCTPSPLRYALTIKTGWKWNYDVVGV